MAKAKSPIDRALDELGGPSKAAAALGISNPSVVFNWRSRGKVPAEYVLALEKISGVSRHELRSDIFGEAA